MRSLLTVLSDESLMNRIKVVLNEDSISYHYASNGEKAAYIAQNNEIAVAIVDFNSNVFTGQEMCELLLSINPEMQFILFFDEKDTKEVLDLYNALHINKLMCRQNLILEELPSLIEACLHTYNRDDELQQMDEELARLNDTYLKPMQEMSSILNERLEGYESSAKVFRESIDFVLNTSGQALKPVDDFVDRILNDYIHIYMIKEPETEAYFNRINEGFNDPEGRKYFKFVKDVALIPEKIKYDVLFCLDVITISFDSFYQYYRGKVALSEETDKENNKVLTINAIYEVRRDVILTEVYGYIVRLINNMLKSYAKDVKFAQKNNIVQYKVSF